MTPLSFHLREIKFRLFYLAFSAISTFFFCYTNSLEILYIIGKPFIELEQTFVFLELTEAFYTIIRISAIFTMFLLIPLFIYQVWSFFIPSFYKLERQSVNLFSFLLVSLLVFEIFFSYIILFPKICQFLMSFEMESEIIHSNYKGGPVISVEFTAQISSYVHLIVKVLGGILLLFQIPLCVCFFYSKKLIHVSSLYSNRKILGLVSLLVSAFIVPPDVISQVIVAVFFFFLFEILIFIGLFFE